MASASQAPSVQPQASLDINTKSIIAVSAASVAALLLGVYLYSKFSGKDKTDNSYYDDETD